MVSRTWCAPGTRRGAGQSLPSTSHIPPRAVIIQHKYPGQWRCSLNGQCAINTRVTWSINPWLMSLPQHHEGVIHVQMVRTLVLRQTRIPSSGRLTSRHRSQSYTKPTRSLSITNASFRYNHQLQQHWFLLRNIVFWLSKDPSRLLILKIVDGVLFFHCRHFWHPSRLLTDF